MDTESDKWTEIAHLSESCLLPRLEAAYAYDTEGSVLHEEDRKHIADTRVQTGQKLAGILTLLKSLHVDHDNVSNTNSQTRVRSNGAHLSPHVRKQLVALISALGEQYALPDSAAHSCVNKPWTNVANAKLVNDIILELQVVFNVLNQTNNQTSAPDFSQLFEEDFKTGINPTKTIFGQLLQVFRSKLVGQDEIWQYHPAAKASFHWILHQVKYPNMSEFIPGSLQPVLNFCDDFQVRNQLDALECFEHVVDNVNKAELCGAGAGNWGEVIYKTLAKMLDFTKNGQVIAKLLPFTLKILKLLEKDPHVHSSKLTLYDEVLEKILHRIEFGSDDNKLKSIWMQQLNSFLDVMGFAILHWMSQIIRILDESTTCNDPKRWLVTLNCVNTCVVNSWVKPDSDSFAQILLKIIYNMSVFDIDCDAQIRNQVLAHSVECLRLLAHNSDYADVRKQLLEITASVKNVSADAGNCDRLQPKFGDVWNRISTELNLL